MDCPGAGDDDEMALDAAAIPGKMVQKLRLDVPDHLGRYARPPVEPSCSTAFDDAAPQQQSTSGGPAGPLNQQVDPQAPLFCSSPLWRPVTELVDAAVAALESREIICAPTFSFQDAMNAIVLNNPAMDSGFADLPRRDVAVELEKHVARLERGEYADVMMGILRALMTWLESHTLPQTLFSCLFLYNYETLRQEHPTLYLYCRLVCSNAGLFRELIDHQRVANEEDFDPWTFGFESQMAVEPHETLERLHKDATLFGADSIISAFVDVQFTIHNALHILRSGPVDDFYEDPIETRIVTSMQACVAAIDHLTSLNLKRSMRMEDLARVPGFDFTINVALLVAAPPRTWGLVDEMQALSALRKVFVEMFAVVRLREDFESLMRMRSHTTSDPCHAQPVSGPSQTTSRELIPHFLPGDCYCLLSLLSRTHTLHIVSRSLLRLLLSSSRPFGMEQLNLTNIMWRSVDPSSQHSHHTSNLVVRLSQLVPNFVTLFCRNRGRQRRMMLNFIESLDGVANPLRNLIMSASFRGLGQKHAELLLRAKAFADLSVLSGIEYFLLLGFECNLYSVDEYLAVYFYLMQVKSASLGGVLPAPPDRETMIVQAGDGNEESTLDSLSTPPNRILNQATYYICSGIFMVLIVIEAAGYIPRRRSHVYADIQMWHEMRFAPVVDRKGSPVPFVNSQELEQIKSQYLNELTGSKSNKSLQEPTGTLVNGIYRGIRAFEKAQAILDELLGTALCEPGLLLHDELKRLLTWCACAIHESHVLIEKCGGANPLLSVQVLLAPELHPHFVSFRATCPKP
ncbi:N-alpha-acetyltransferase 35, NatC auxiliary subunit [Porphyridium purpureum]|uniref:N-alpha-acetyltransferase 35, NatC auxiliary subunit n=1 Tax=Porphyridium purpureum TaxID=35688 RepID=A0A5J4Z445_PORPP|nr:N-alpha-acetyltransferase 35, NatC auxiliary subunit [Porphyridium purpureum]|eukprot:POR1808..scf295_1